MPQVVYRLVGDTSDLEAKLDGVEAALRGVGKSATTTERKVKKSTDTGSKGAKKLSIDFRALTDVAEGFGGGVAAAAGGVDKFAKSTAAAGARMGPWGAAIAAVTIGLGGLAWAATEVATAAVEFVSSADEMIDRLNEIAGIEAIPDRTLEQLAEFESMMLAAEVRAGTLKTVIAGDLGEALSDMGWALVGVMDWLAKFYVAVGDSADEVERLSDEVAESPIAFVAAFAAEKFREFADSVREAHKELTDMAGVKFDEFGPSFELFEKNEERKTKAAEDAAKERAKIAKIGEDELRKGQEETAKENDAELKAALDKWKADQAERVRINEEASAQIVSDVAEATAKIDAFYEALGEAIKEAMFSALNATADLVDHFAGQAMEREQAKLDRQKAIQEESWGGFKDHLDRIESLEKELAGERDAERRKQLQDEIDAQQKIVDKAKEANDTKRTNAKIAAEKAHKAMVKAFRAQKAAQISSVIIDGAAAFLGLLEAFSPLGPFAPVAAAGITGPAVAVNIAKIASEKPPKFHDGIGAVDEMLATLRSGEAVLSQRGAQAAGGPQAIEALNRGTPPGPTTLVFQYAGRAVERVVLDAMQRGGPLQAAMAGGPAGVANPYGSK